MAVEIDALELTKKINITLRLKNVRQFQIRIWLATQLMALAALIGGFGIEVMEMEDGES